LSPGAASFDQFPGFAQRGECFRALVNKVSDTHPAIGKSQITSECGGHREHFD
jgi:hypothetical protein